MVTYRTVARIENEIDDLLLPYLFDISILSYIEDPNVVAQIEKTGVLFYTQQPKHPTTD